MLICNAKDCEKSLIKDLSGYKDPIFAKYTTQSFFSRKKAGTGKEIFSVGQGSAAAVCCQKYRENINLKNVERLLRHKIHEVRLTALLILVKKYKKRDSSIKSAVVKIYF